MADPRLRYIQLLPAIFQPDGGAGDQAFLDAYLTIFQQLLDRRADPDGAAATGTHRRGMAELIDILPQLFDPRLGFLFPGDDAFIPPFAPEHPPSPTYTDVLMNGLNDYVGAIAVTKDTQQPAIDAAVSDWIGGLLDWQAGWIGLIPDGAWSLDRKRQVLATALPLFRRRGTAGGLQALLTTFIDADITVTDVGDAPALVVGRSTVLADAFAPDDAVVGGIRPFSFVIVLTVPTYDIDTPPIQAQAAAIRALADREKPALADYTIQVATTLTRLGINTIVATQFLVPKES